MKFIRFMENMLRKLNNIETTIKTKVMGQYVGEDEFGNKYYEQKKSSNPRRWVVYNGIVEASKVPAHWEGWLRGSCDKLEAKEHEWQKEHQPNLSCTDKAYKYSISPKADKFRDSKGNKYIPWQM